jgi:hypothetical protein
MDTTTQTKQVFVVAKTAKKRKALSHLPSQFEQIKSIAEKFGWNNQNDIKLFGKGEMITNQVTINGWILKPINLHKSIIPSEAMQRVMELINAGIRIKGIVIADDARKYEVKQVTVPKPAPVPTPTPSPIPLPRETNTISIGDIVGGVLEVGVVGVSILGAVFTALLFDPVLIVVLEDFQWVSLYIWYD